MRHDEHDLSVRCAKQVRNTILSACPKHKRITLLKPQPLAEIDKQFIISKSKTTYRVTIKGYEVIVDPVIKQSFYSVSNTIAYNLQTIGNTRLLLDRPADPFQYLKDYYEEKGWAIEDV